MVLKMIRELRTVRKYKPKKVSREANSDERS